MPRNAEPEPEGAQDQDWLQQRERPKGEEHECEHEDHEPEDCPQPARHVEEPDSEDPGDEERALPPKRKRAARKRQASGVDSAHVAAAGFPERGLTWLAPCTAELMVPSTPIQRAFPRARTIKLKGTFIDTTVNENRWAVPASELASIARQLSSGAIQLRTDHSEEVHKVIGRYERGILYDRDGDPIGQDASDDDLMRAARVDFEATMTTENPDVAIPVLMGYVSGISPHVDPGMAECGVCGKLIEGMPTCDHFATMESPGFLLLRNVKVREGSIVPTPAYGERTKFLPVGFAAGLQSIDKELRNMVEAAAAKAAKEPAASDERLMASQARLAAMEDLLAAERMKGEALKARLEAAEVAAQFQKKNDEDEEEKKKKAAEKAAAEQKPPTLEEKLAATRQGAKAGAEPAGEQPPKRPWGAMSGSLDLERSNAKDFLAWGEISDAIRGEKPLGRFGGVADGMMGSPGKGGR